MLGLIDVEVLLKDKNGGNRLRFMSAFSAYNDVKKKKVQVFSSSWAFFRCVTEKIKVIKTQAEPKQSYFPKGSFDKKVKCNRT